MTSLLNEPSFYRIVSRDRLSYVGCMLCSAGVILLFLLPLHFRTMPVTLALVFAAFPFCAGAGFLLPRLYLHRRLYREGRTAQGRVVEKNDVQGPNSGSRILYRYMFEDKEYEAEARTHWIVENVRFGDEVTVLLNRQKPSQSLLPILYV